MSLKERLALSDNLFLRGKFTQLNDFIDQIKELALPPSSIALSVSTGDGMWDYLAFENNQNIKKIIATDIVDNPVKEVDKNILMSSGEWEFIKVQPESSLPFPDKIFNLIFHQDVVEHVQKPFSFLKEEYRVLGEDGILIFGTPNLFRPANILKLIFARLRFPVKIGYNDEIGDYIHVQEFYEQQMKVLLYEVGFRNISVYHSFWGIPSLRIVFSKHPKGILGKSMCHYLIFKCKK